MTTAKICGLKTAEAVQAALDGKASHLGFMFFDNSPRNIDVRAAELLARPARWKADIVAVLVDPDDDTVDRIADTLKPHLFQLHGAETPARVAQIASPPAVSSRAEGRPGPSPTTPDLRGCRDGWVPGSD
jgi:phosphoribosylanthranilate isomerase